MFTQCAQYAYIIIFQKIIKASNFVETNKFHQKWQMWKKWTCHYFDKNDTFTTRKTLNTDQCI